MKPIQFRAAMTAVYFGVAVALAVGSGSANAAEASPQAGTADWDMAGDIVSKIQFPSIPKRDYIVTSFGAAGDGKQDARPAILAAIEQAAKEGGGRVVLPKGIWLSKGPIHLKSRIDLHVFEGATLLFGPNSRDYLPEVKTRWEGTEVMGYSPLIYARNVEDVAITGKGTIDGNGESEFHGWKAKEKPVLRSFVCTSHG